MISFRKNFGMFVCCLILSFSQFLHSQAQTQMTAPGMRCLVPVEREQAEHAYAIANAVFIDKFVRSFKEGLINEEFFNSIQGIKLTICDEGSYEATGYSDGEIVLDYRLIAFTFLQARALVIGGYLSYEKGQKKSFHPYDSLLEAFFNQEASLKANAHQIAVDRAVQEGMKRQKLTELMSTEKFQTAEQKIFMVMLYFLASHELCHFALNHHLDRVNQDIKVLLNQEYEADACALNLVNLDEARSKGAPVGFIGAVAMLGSQAMLTKIFPEVLREQPTHPTPLSRFGQARDIALSYVESLNIDQSRKSVYAGTTEGLADYFSQKLNK